jgi:hypothetical protein
MEQPPKNKPPKNIVESGVKSQSTGIVQEPKRVPTLQDAITTLSGLPGHAAVYRAFSEAAEELVRQMETTAPPRLQAVDWLILWARYYVRLVNDLASWDSFRTILIELIHPTASLYLFGVPNVVPQSEKAMELVRLMDAAVRHWLQKASGRLARQRTGPGRPRARRRGFPAAVERHRIVRAEASRFGDKWIHHLPEICRALDGKVPRLANNRLPWADIAEDLALGHSKLRERVRKYLAYRIHWPKAARKPKVARSVSKSG